MRNRIGVLHGDNLDALDRRPAEHYSWALCDAVEVAGLPAVEVHLSDVDSREEFRRISVLTDVVVARVSGQGVDGYRDALERLKGALE